MSNIAIYQTDPMHTSAGFEVQHFATSTVRARFEKISGCVELDDTARTGRTDIVIDAASIISGIAEFDEHLKSDAFLDVARHPTIRFVGSEFKWVGDELIAVAGALTLLGATHWVTLECINFNRYDSPILHAPVVGGDFVAIIRRSQWGMDWGIDLGVPDTVRLVIQVEAVKQ